MRKLLAVLVSFAVLTSMAAAYTGSFSPEPADSSNDTEVPEEPNSTENETEPEQPSENKVESERGVFTYLDAFIGFLTAPFS